MYAEVNIFGVSRIHFLLNKLCEQGQVHGCSQNNYNLPPKALAKDWCTYQIEQKLWIESVKESLKLIMNQIKQVVVWIGGNVTIQKSQVISETKQMTNRASQFNSLLFLWYYIYSWNCFPSLDMIFISNKLSN